jgi:pSer/pThr/pTyr-binding forkhead associated (FHA) protein
MRATTCFRTALASRTFQHWVIALFLVFAFAPVVSAADAQPSGTSSNLVLWAAVITGTFSMVGLILQLRSNAQGAQATSKREQEQRQQELALKIVDTISKDRTAARRFAIGLVKVEKVGEQDESSDERGKVYFIPVNSRITVGRDEENDIHLYDPNLKDKNRYLSRFQCGFVADQHEVIVEDFISANGTLVSDPNGNETAELEGARVKFAPVRHRKLVDGDRIWVGSFVLRFKKLQENRILL